MHLFFAPLALSAGKSVRILRVSPRAQTFSFSLRPWSQPLAMDAMSVRTPRLQDRMVVSDPSTITDIEDGESTSTEAGNPMDASQGRNEIPNLCILDETGRNPRVFTDWIIKDANRGGLYARSRAYAGEVQFTIKSPPVLPRSGLPPGLAYIPVWDKQELL